MQLRTTTIFLALSFLVVSSGYTLAQTDESAQGPVGEENTEPLQSDYPNIISPVSDCPNIAEKYRSGGPGADPLGYPPDFGYPSMSAADQAACIAEINKDGNINEALETQEENNILQN